MTIELDGAPVNYYGLPEDHMDTVRLYLEHGFQPGSGWMAILSNDLLAVVAVDASTFQQLPQIYRWLVNHCPSAAWGSRFKVLEWMQQRRAEEQNAKTA